MSPESFDLPVRDVAPERAARIQRRAHRVLRRWADPFAQTWLGRVERTWIDRLEPLAAGVGGSALVLWSIAVVFA